MNESDDNAAPPVLAPFSDDLFREWRSPRFGKCNPERMDNPVWDWLVRTGLDAYQATELCHGPSAEDAGPGWCFDRFGLTATILRDGRTVLIAGEHEDFYDPDFCIYNDVIVRHADGRVEIFGYPFASFRPTAFHTATLLDDRIIVIGGIGYRDQRKPGFTQVLGLELGMFAVREITTSGEAPGRLHGHTACKADDGQSIFVTGGMIARGKEGLSSVENLDEWRLHLAEWRWERLTRRTWQRLEVLRRDRKFNHLWAIRTALWHREIGWKTSLRASLDRLAADGLEPDLDLVSRLFRPEIPHDEVPSRENAEGEYGVFRIKVKGVTVRYVEANHSVQMTVEGDLPKETIAALGADLLHKLETLENTPCELRAL